MLLPFCDWLVYDLFGVTADSNFGSAIHFFIYDSIKILLLLYLMIGFVGVVRTYISQEKIKKYLSGRKKGVSYIITSLFGVLTPFCSCSSIPIFMSFIEAGVPIGVAFSFLVTSPLVNEYLVVLMLGFFGLKVTALYVLLGITLGIFSGVITTHLNAEKYLVEDFKTSKKNTDDVEYKKFSERVKYGISEASSIVKKLWIWVLIGVAIGAIIHGFVPEEAIDNLLSKTCPFSVPLAALVGIPIYANCSAVVPIAAALFQKGVPLGTALAFMMATAALSLPEAVILRRIMKLKLITIFFSMVGLGIIIIGYILNAVG